MASPLPVAELAEATVGCALLAAAELAEARGGRRPGVALEAGALGAVFRSERFVLVDGASPGAAFDPLSRFLPTADGWIRLHANYPHHRAALLHALGLRAGHEQRVPAAVAAREAVALEAEVVAAGGCAAALRDERRWHETPAGAALAGRTLLDVAPGAGATEAADRTRGTAGFDPAQPAAGARILDLTRVIAGPVGTRYLAALGAEVLRIDPPALPELRLQAIDTGPGKRSAQLDLRRADDRERLERLLAEADVVVQGYRPGALAAFGLDPAALTARHPRLSTVTLSAWGDRGPWAERRGFDSLVQAATGIAARVGADGADGPGALPAQALDHGTGYLIAAAALRGLARRARGEGPLHARLALARTASWLLDRPAGEQVGAADGGQADSAGDPEPERIVLPSPFGVVSLVAPPGRIDGQALGWARGPVPAGHDPAAWAAARRLDRVERCPSS